MPRRIIEQEPAPKPRYADLTVALAEELKAAQPSGQPLIHEKRYETGLVAATVIWDKWQLVPAEERSRVILRAYESALGKDFVGKLAIAVGYTVPEAQAGGLLPYEVFAARRDGDPVSDEQCQQALLSEGASRLFPDRPRLRFGTQEDAEAAVKRLVEKLPQSGPVWVITQDVGSIEQWYNLG